MAGSGNANVQSLDAVRDVRLALIAFQERVIAALDELRTRIDRTMAWLEQDRPMYWRDQERRAYDLVSTTRIAYEICRMKTVGGRHPECIEERVAHQRAKERLAYCKVKVDTVRRWCIEAGRQVDEFRGRCSPLKSFLDSDVPNAIAMLGRMIDALDAYADVQNKSATGPAVSLGSVDDSDDEPDPANVATEPDPSLTPQDGHDAKSDSQIVPGPADDTISSNE